MLAYIYPPIKFANKIYPSCISSTMGRTRGQKYLVLQLFS